MPSSSCSESPKYTEETLNPKLPPEINTFDWSGEWEKFQKGKLVFRIPAKRFQKFELKNISKNANKYQVRLHSSRFEIPGSYEVTEYWDGHCLDSWQFVTDLLPGHSVIFTIKDRIRPVEFSVLEYFEGYIRVAYKPVGDQEYWRVVSDFILDLDPPSDSYRETRRKKNSKVRGPVQFCGLNEPKNEHFSLEPIDEKKYEKLPETIKILPLESKSEEKKVKIPEIPKKNDTTKMKKKKCTIL
ncbi:hypothetical protein B9Z55_027253 [Caenorhabditis nigoni]|uniref:Uncharacterized protein n=1 Tax=Caenorhabditis nigoni TaxID=1611254 RepID=A0A2G5SHC6_9PELO|nr:hypothetical protein B9Z55_027253 [Caenorhabditis nigoni]